jgi:GT2 family glycosyltransferase
MSASEEHPPAAPKEEPEPRLRPAPQLSIIVLTHNRRQLLRGCLESLWAQADWGTSFEVVVADDGSSDGTGDMVRRLAVVHPELSYHYQPWRGIAAARNLGLRHASGEVVAIVADDYLLAPDYARTVLRFFADHPEAAVVRFKVVAGSHDFVSRVCHAYQEASVKRRLAEGLPQAGRRPSWRAAMEEEKTTSRHGLEAAGGAAFRREVFRRVGVFDESLPRGEDTDFTRRLRAAGIPVFYFPFHEIRHRYSPSLGAALRTAFLSGRGLRRYQAKVAAGGVRLASLLSQGLALNFLSLYWACWRARQTRSLGRFVLYLPFLFLLEMSNKSGFLAEGLWPRKKSGR